MSASQRITKKAPGFQVLLSYGVYRVSGGYQTRTTLPDFRARALT